MKNMDKGLTVSKWVLINRTKTPQMPKLSAQAQMLLHWASVVRALVDVFMCN